MHKISSKTISLDQSAQRAHLPSPQRSGQSWQRGGANGSGIVVYGYVSGTSSPLSARSIQFTKRPIKNPGARTYDRPAPHLIGESLPRTDSSTNPSNTPACRSHYHLCQQKLARGSFCLLDAGFQAQHNHTRSGAVTADGIGRF